MKINILRNTFFNFAILTIYVEFFILCGVLIYNIFNNGQNYISIYLVLRIIFILNFLVLPVSIVSAIIEYYIRNKFKKNRYKEKNIGFFFQILYFTAIILFIIITAICVFAGFPPTIDELRYD